MNRKDQTSRKKKREGRSFKRGKDEAVAKRERRARPECLIRGISGEKKTKRKCKIKYKIRQKGISQRELSGSSACRG